MVGRHPLRMGRDALPVPCFFRRIVTGATVAIGLAAAPVHGSAQLLERPWLDWRTVRAGRFAVHCPTELEPWARFVARHMQDVDSAVTRLVGYSPPGRVDVVVEDPYNVANGLAFTAIRRPVIVLWATPPDPRETIGEFRSWGEMLAVHEFAHVAHLTRPSRNPFRRALWRLSPIDLGPIALRAPRWVLEGYATYVEGVLTGSGRPHGVWRPAILRQWAIEGRLPSYAELSNWGDFEGGDFAYLAGSAFLEWLASRDGDSTLVHVWRRLTARVNRSFDQAFSGVYGDAPADLYGRFIAELTASAMRVERELERAGLAEGELVQHLAWGTGDPAASPDGSRIALVLRSKSRPSRVVVWRAEAEPDTLELRARERLLRRDPEDVPARRVYPAPKRAVATLLARGGRAYEDPRWFPDGKRLLLWRATRLPDGAQRPDLYEWNVESRGIRRITRGAGLRDADPSPDGHSAVALRCGRGQCDVVLVDLGRGSIRSLVSGDTTTSFSHPRFSPDGRSIAAAMLRAGRWRIALLDPADGALRVVDPDDGANRFDPAWLSTNALVVVSDRSGAPNLERLGLGADTARSPVQTLTRVTGAAVAPVLNRADSSIWFLSLHSHGYDVRRLSAGARAGDSLASPLLDARLGAVVLQRSPAMRAPLFASRELPAARRYRGTAYRATRWLPSGQFGVGGRAFGLALVNSDVVGRLTLLAQGQMGSGTAWRGAALDASWRGMRPEVQASIFVARDADGSSANLQGSPLITTQLRGLRARIDFTHAFDLANLRVGAGVADASLERTPQTPSTRESRFTAFSELMATARQTGDDGITSSQTVAMHGTLGRDDKGAAFRRWLMSVTVRGGGGGAPLVELSATHGRVTPHASPFEHFVVGGLPSTLIDPSLLTQRLVMPALPNGVAAGDRVLSYRAAVAVGPLFPFYWGASVHEGAGRFDRWHRVAGIELMLDQEPLSVLGTPGVRLTGGLARSMDEPFARHVRGYVSIALRP